MEEKKEKRPQISVTFSREDFARIESIQERFNKRDMSLILWEMYQMFVDLYEKVEEERLQGLQRARQAHSGPPAIKRKR